VTPVVGKDDAHYFYDKSENCHREEGSKNGKKKYLKSKIPIDHGAHPP
jgi:hypothetical protein